jgi:hypothetical protein
VTALGGTTVYIESAVAASATIPVDSSVKRRKLTFLSGCEPTLNCELVFSSRAEIEPHKNTRFFVAAV